MSSTPDNNDTRGHQNTLIRLDDSPDDIYRKIRQAVSNSGNRTEDICYIYGRLLDLPEECLKAYVDGELSTSQFKDLIAAHITALLADFR